MSGEKKGWHARWVCRSCMKSREVPWSEMVPSPEAKGQWAAKCECGTVYTPLRQPPARFVKKLVAMGRAW